MRQSIEIVRGTSNTLAIAVTDANSNPYTLQAGEVIVFGVKKNASDEDYVLLKTATQGADGVYNIEINPEDTAGVEPGEYVYDVGLESGVEYYNIIPLTKLLIVANVTKWGDANASA